MTESTWKHDWVLNPTHDGAWVMRTQLNKKKKKLYYMLLLSQKLVLISINNFAVFKIPKQENKEMYILRD